MSTKESHAPSWTAVLVLGLAGASCLWVNTRKTVLTYPPPPAISAGSQTDSFLMLRMPEITAQRESGIDTMKIRMDQWLSALTKEGFRPLLLSEVGRRLKEEGGLPERTVVIFFNPGYRRTYEIVAPIFARRQCPAVWLTHEGAMERSDRRYVTYHTARQMKASGGWDVGYSDKPGIFRVESLRNKSVIFGSKKNGAWSPVAGALALNRGAWQHGLNFLTVNADWEANELISRLRVETPAIGKVCLAKARIHNREWGVSFPNLTPQDAQFDLQVPWTKRGAKLFWLGTLGSPHFQLHAQAASFIGELWFQLRFDEARGNDLHLIMTHQHILIEQMTRHKNRRLLSASYREPASGEPWTMDLLLDHQHLSVSLNGHAPWILDNVNPAISGQGMLQLYLTDKLRGIAKAKAVRLTFVPLRYHHEN